MLLVHAGNRIDLPGRIEPRFPAAAVVDVRPRIERLLFDLSPEGVVSAAASGADLLVLDAAQGLGIPVWIVLPLTEDQFLETSVSDQGQEWIDRYHRVRAAATEVAVADLSAHDDWYLRGNDVILARAEAVAAELGGGEPVGISALVIRPAVNDGRSATDDFAAKARKRGMTSSTWTHWPRRLDRRFKGDGFLLMLELPRFRACFDALKVPSTVAPWLSPGRFPATDDARPAREPARMSAASCPP